MARRADWQVKDKHLRRLWREEGLRVPQHRRKEVSDRYQRRRRHDDTDPAQRHLGDGLIKMLNVIDGFTREPLAIGAAVPSKPIGSSRCWIAWPAPTGKGLVPAAPKPHHVRFDNGPEFVRHAVRDCCRFSSAGSLFIDPGSPWQNAWVESFNGRLRNELLNSWRFDPLRETRLILEGWRRDYHANRPHSAHGELTPTEFAPQWTTTRQPQAA